MALIFRFARKTSPIMRGTYYTESEAIQMDRVRHRWAAIYVSSCFSQNKRKV